MKALDINIYYQERQFRGRFPDNVDMFCPSELPFAGFIYNLVFLHVQFSNCVQILSAEGYNINVIIFIFKDMYLSIA